MGSIFGSLLLQEYNVIFTLEVGDISLAVWVSLAELLVLFFEHLVILLQELVVFLLNHRCWPHAASRDWPSNDASRLGLILCNGTTFFLSLILVLCPLCFISIGWKHWVARWPNTLVLIAIRWECVGRYHILAFLFLKVKCASLFVRQIHWVEGLTATETAHTRSYFTIRTLPVTFGKSRISLDCHIRILVQAWWDCWRICMVYVCSLRFLWRFPQRPRPYMPALLMLRLLVLIALRVVAILQQLIH